MRRICSLLVCMIFFDVITSSASIPKVQNGSKEDQHVTDKMLKRIAVEKGIIPGEPDQAFFNAEVKKKNTVTIWIMLDNTARLSIIDNLRKLNKDDGVTIRLPSEYYVNEITGYIYNSIVKGDIVVMELGNILKTIAVMEGDYDNGKDKVTFAKEYMGEDGFKVYKGLYPEKYEKLLKK